MALDGEAVVKELRDTFGSGKTKSYEWRVSQLKAILKITEYHEHDIVQALASDLSKPEFESFVHEIALLKEACNYALKKLKSWMAPEKVPTLMSGDDILPPFDTSATTPCIVKTPLTTFPSSGSIVSEPLGVILVISAWNFPFILSLDPVIGAISSGNSVVLKPSEIAPATSALLAKLLGDYMDTSAVKVIEGGVPETSVLLKQRWDKIFYTGSGKVGRIVLAAAAKNLTPVALELGGKCPVIVDADTNLNVTARRIIAGKWGCNNGQACISPDHIITTTEFAPKLIEAMKSNLEKFYGKDPLKSSDLSRIVNIDHFHRLKKLLDDDKVSGKIVFGGESDLPELKISPTILLDVPEEALIMKEEIFGPLLPILTVKKIEDGIRLINSREKPLAAYLFTDGKKLKEEFVRGVSAGGLVVNDTALHLTILSLPFGGVGESGMGAYHGKFSYDAFSHKKAVLSRNFMGDVAARYPPYTPWKLRLLKALFNGNIFGIIRSLFGW